MPIAKAHTLQHVSGALRTPQAQYITARSAESPLTTTTHGHIRWEMCKHGHETKPNRTLPYFALSVQPCIISFGLVAVQKNTDVCLSHGV